MILAKARQESRDFFEVLDYYLELIRKLHIRTYNYIGEMRASTNPLAYCEGGFLGGNLKPSDKIKPLLKPMTMSFGITALNELQQLYNGKSLAEEGTAYLEAQKNGEDHEYFALQVMQYINQRLVEFKHEDGILYAVYGTPAENLCGLQIQQFRKQFGIIENVSDREFVSNSFHCHVTEDITPIQKQDLENIFWNLFNGGKIQYVRYPLGYNIEAMKTLILRAMKMGFYEGANLSLAYCEECGHEELEMEVCPKCGSKNLTKIDRMNGYLAFSRVKGDTRLNAAKMEEIKVRRSM
jgi:ribonucleoside-triphosphate reductase